MFQIVVLIGAVAGIIAGLMPAHGSAGNGFAAVALGGGLWVLFQSGEFKDWDGREMIPRGFWRTLFPPRNWGDTMAPEGWADLLLARNRASDWYARAYLRGPQWLRKTFERVALGLTIMINIDLFVLPWQNALGRWANHAAWWAGIALAGWALVWAGWVVIADRRHKRQRGNAWDTEYWLDQEETADEVAIVQALGGMGALGARLSVACCGAESVLPNFWRGLLLAVPFIGTALRFLWPDYHEAAILVATGIAMMYFNYQFFLYRRLRDQAAEPDSVSPCRSLPLRYFLRKIADIRDWNGRLAVGLQAKIKDAERDIIQNAP